MEGATEYTEASADLGCILDQAKYFLRKEMQYGNKKQEFQGKEMKLAWNE